MAGGEDDRFRPRVGAPRRAVAKGRTGKFVSRVLTAANCAGPLRVGRRPGAARLARGSNVARLIGRGGGRTARRVTVKVRLVVLAQAGPRSVASHLAYIQRDAVGRDGERGQAYGRDGDAVDASRFEERGRDDRHQFRLIVAPEDGDAIGDLKSFTRDLMRQMETDLGTRLDWIAVDHHDTGHAHSHVVLRGVDETGRDLVIARDYIGHGMRARASELATAWLGPRTEYEIAASRDREVTSDRWTGLDQTLSRAVGDDGRVRLETANAQERAVLRDRLRHLETLGLANRDDEGWRISPKAEPTLRALGERGDIVRTMQRALGSASREIALPADSPTTAVIGRVAGKGLVDEMGDRGWLAVDGIDGRAHYVPLPKGSDLATWPVGGIVEVRTGERASDRAIAGVARGGIFELPKDDPLGLGRRLESLRRAGVVERLGASTWRVPDNLVERGAAHDRAQGGRVMLRSTIGIDAQVRSIGATWLDATLVKAEAMSAPSGFGAEVRAALDKRADVLEAEGLARRSGNRLLLARDLLAQLRTRDLAAAGREIAAETGLAFRPVDSGRISGTLVKAIDRPSGRFAMLDDGAGGFALVPWRPVVEHRIGQSIAAVVSPGGGVSWELGRTRGLGM